MRSTQVAESLALTSHTKDDEHEQPRSIVVEPAAGVVPIVSLEANGAEDERLSRD